MCREFIYCVPPALYVRLSAMNRRTVERAATQSGLVEIEISSFAGEDLHPSCCKNHAESVCWGVLHFTKHIQEVIDIHPAALAGIVKSIARFCEINRITGGAPYENFMGRSSRLFAGSFIDWLSPCRGLKWFDAGCGTGALREVVIKNHAPAALTDIDESEGFVAIAQKQ